MLAAAAAPLRAVFDRLSRSARLDCASQSRSSAQDDRVSLGNVVGRSRLLGHCGAHGIERARGAELQVFVGNELRVFVHEGLAWRAEVELTGLVAEELAMHARPDESAV